MFKLKYSSEAKRELRQISKQLEQKAVADALIDIQTNPKIGKPLNNELNGRFSYRVKSHRIVYVVNLKDEIVTIITAKHRSTVYN